MQVLYVVEFDVRPRNASIDLYETTLGSIASWLTFTSGQRIDRVTLATRGRLEMRPNKSGSPRTAIWEATGTKDAKAIRVEIRDGSEESGSAFVTRLTLGHIGTETTVRVSMARESSPTWLSPAPPADLWQPGVIRSLLENDQIVLAINGQIQDGRYLQVRDDAEVSTLAEAIRTPSRLPILLVHTRTLPALKASRESAAKLVGLVRVVTIDYRALRTLDAEIPGFAPPFAGARLIWSDPSARTVSFDEQQLNSENSDLLRAHLMRLLAPTSVLARGLDRAFREARRAEVADQDRSARARTAHALAEGNTSAQIEALQDELSAVRSGAYEWQQLATDEEDRASRFQAQAEKVPTLEAEIEQLKVALQASITPPDAARPEEDPWATLPPLITGDAFSAENLFLHLQDAGSGHILFTDRAATTWKKSKYPFPDEMAECLTKLTRVAATLYDDQDRTYPHLDTWMRDEFDLKVALQDDRIEKNAKLRDFEYDGRTHNRTPHVKVRDHTAPSQVGRIHFALDSGNRRIIVDHVGLKLY
ncbi:hypothetical protein [Rhodococcus sp. NPDC059234]|uniref:hypothetical protein n=1 Tax=Rhodococcus sp. NPDC059234 TaxID=3346781 RepID=UPI003670BD8E